MQDTYKKYTIGSHRAYGDFWTGASDDEVIIEGFSAKWTIPSAPVAPHNQTDLMIWAGLGASNSDNQIQLVLWWISSEQKWLVTVIYHTSSGVTQNYGGYDVRPGYQIEGDIILNKTDDVIKYDVIFKLWDEGLGGVPIINFQTDMPCVLNRAILSVDQNTTTYLDLPPDDFLNIYTSAKVANSSFGLSPDYNAYWTFEGKWGATVPSGKMGWVANPSIESGEVVFGFK